MAKKTTPKESATEAKPIAAPKTEPVKKAKPTISEAEIVVTPKAVKKAKPTSKKAVDEVIVVAEVQGEQLKAVEVYSLLTDFDIALFKSGKHFKLYEKFGSHVVTHKGVVGTYFAVWAPNAQYISVIGNFNGWNRGSHALYVRWDGSGVWEGFIPNIGDGETYKYYINSNSGEDLEKSDPFALRWEEPPRTASIVTHTYYQWKDQEWMATRAKNNSLNAPISVYEMHFGSWARGPEDPQVFLSYRDMAGKLVPYLLEMGFTHVEFMPLAEHPFYPSWGYQIVGFFAASSRYGSPQDLMYLIEELHKAGIGVLFDWVPSHFPGDAHGIYNFDGTHLYEHPDPRKGYHPDWTSYIFNYGRNEVRAFLISNALFWLDRYHVDGLRVDAVASMLYLDYSRKQGEWEPNIYGGNTNLEVISLLKEFNEAVYSHFPDTQTIAEESTSFNGVSRPTFMGGLGFGMKWMMGWMNDTLKYFKQNPINRKYHHGQITFSTVYGFTENFMLPLSHDEVVYGKKSLLRKMPGDEWQQFANLRLLYSYMFTYSGTKLLFMGGEFGQSAEWNFQQSLDWHLLQYPSHNGIKETVKALNNLYRTEPALYEKNFSSEGFQWIDGGNANDSVLVYTRKGNDEKDDVVIILNMTPVTRTNFRVGVPYAGTWKEIFNSDDHNFWGAGNINYGELESEPTGWNWKENSVVITAPPLGAVVLKRV